MVFMLSLSSHSHCYLVTYLPSELQLAPSRMSLNQGLVFFMFCLPEVAFTLTMLINAITHTKPQRQYSGWESYGKQLLASSLDILPIPEL